MVRHFWIPEGAYLIRVVLLKCTRHRYCGMEASVLVVRSARRHLFIPYFWLHVSGWSCLCWRCEAPAISGEIIWERSIPIEHQNVIRWPFFCALHFLYDVPHVPTCLSPQKSAGWPTVRLCVFPALRVFANLFPHWFSWKRALWCTTVCHLQSPMRKWANGTSLAHHWHTHDEKIKILGIVSQSKVSNSQNYSVLRCRGHSNALSGCRFPLHCTLSMARRVQPFHACRNKGIDSQSTANKSQPAWCDNWTQSCTPRAMHTVPDHNNCFWSNTK